MIFRSLPSSVSTLAEKRQVLVRASSPSVDLAGDIVEQSGIILSAYHANPVVLWQHDPAQPIARAIQTGMSGGNLTALVQFPPTGTSEQSDEAWRLIQAGIVSTVSIGFDPIKTEPLHGGRRGVKYLQSLLLEISFVSIPANGDAGVIARAARSGARISAETSNQLAEIEEAARLAAHHAAKAQSMAGALGNGQNWPVGDDDDGDWSGGDAGENFAAASYRRLVARALDPHATLSPEDLLRLSPDQRAHRARTIENEFGDFGADAAASQDVKRYLNPSYRRELMRRVRGW
jgi:HK97 family phage prohead protease